MDADQLFGEWIKELRIKKIMLGLLEASEELGISIGRLKALEEGNARVGVTKKECQRIAYFYRVSEKEALIRAIYSPFEEEEVIGITLLS